MKDILRCAVPAGALILALCAPMASAAQEKPAQKPAEQAPDPAAPGARDAHAEDSDPEAAPTFSKPVVYNGSRAIERSPGDHLGVSKIGIVHRMRYYIPRGWIKEPPLDPTVLVQLRIPAAEDSGLEDAMVVFYPARDSSPNEILDGWLNEIDKPEWTPEIEIWQLDLGATHGLNITLLTGVGVYTGGRLTGESAEPQPNSMVLGAIIEGSPDGMICIKAVGDKNLMESSLGWWQRMIRSFLVTTPPPDYRQPAPGQPGSAIPAPGTQRSGEKPKPE